MIISKKYVAVYKISHLYNRQMEKVGHWQEHRNATPSWVVKKRGWYV